MNYFISNQISSLFYSFLNNPLLSQFFQHLLLFLLQHPLICYHIYHEIFWQIRKAISFNIFSIFWFCWKSHFYNAYPMISVKLTLSSISNASLTCPVKQNLRGENSVLTVFIIAKKCRKIFINSPNCLFERKVIATF